MKYLTWQDIYRRIEKLPDGKIYGVPRGGAVIAGMTGRAVDTPEEADYILDDLIDSGATCRKWADRYPDKPFVALYNKVTEPDIRDSWLVFPYELGEQEKDKTDCITRLLEHYDDINREGLKETPKRYVKFLDEFLRPPEFNFTTFESEGYDEMIMQRDIPFYSLCEHHLAPFHGKATVAYIPDKKIVGLSKLARTVDMFARRLQNQERITQQVAQFLQQHLQPLGVAVVLEAEHLCMSMRGVQKPHAKTKTSAMMGAFKDNVETRAEFMQLLQ